MDQPLTVLTEVLLQTKQHTSVFMSCGSGKKALYVTASWRSWNQAVTMGLVLTSGL